MPVTVTSDGQTAWPRILARNIRTLHSPACLSSSSARTDMTEILVIGAGEYGLTTALELARTSYRDKADKILVIGNSATASLYVFTHLLIVLLLQIAMPTHQLRMRRATISTRLFAELMTETQFFRIWELRASTNGTVILSGVLTSRSQEVGDSKPIQPNRC